MNKDTELCLNYIKKIFEITEQKSNTNNALDMIREIIDNLYKEYKI